MGRHFGSLGCGGVETADNRLIDGSIDGWAHDRPTGFSPKKRTSAISVLRRPHRQDRIPDASRVRPRPAGHGAVPNCWYPRLMAHGVICRSPPRLRVGQKRLGRWRRANRGATTWRASVHHRSAQQANYLPHRSSDLGQGRSAVRDQRRRRPVGRQVCRGWTTDVSRPLTRGGLRRGAVHAL